MSDFEGVFVFHENYPMMPYGDMLDFVNKWLNGIIFYELIIK